MDVDKISQQNLRLAALAIEKKCDAALSEWKTYRDSHSLKAQAEKQRLAYLCGVLHGLYQAVREIEVREPLDFHESDA